MYDLAIIGAGWAGYNAALRAKELNLKVALIEKAFTGGVCLNSGCIPAKSLIQSVRVLNLIKRSSDFGIDSLEPHLNFSKAQQRKNKIVEGLRSGMQFMLKGVDLFNSEAKIISPQEIDLNGKIIKTKFILLATGSTPQELDQLKFDGKKILSSNDILSFDEVPPSLLIIGGGAIGCEFAGLFASLGTKVMILEKRANLLPGVDSEIAKRIENIFIKKGISISTNADLLSVNLKNFSRVLVCVGRSVKVNVPGLEKIKVEVDNGRVMVDEYLKTSLENVYAAGDCTAQVMLAHFAAYQGRLAVDNMFSKDGLKRSDHLNVPNCIYTDPEVAFVGLSEEAALKRSADIVINKFDFLGSGMARLIGETQGLLKIISEKNTGLILGASIIGPKATEIIGILTLALSSGLTLKQLRSAIFAHPTLSESISEALR
jgi:dihydrolipoamide dehydrogenase